MDPPPSRPPPRKPPLKPPADRSSDAGAAGRTVSSAAIWAARSASVRMAPGPYFDPRRGARPMGSSPNVPVFSS